MREKLIAFGASIGAGGALAAAALSTLCCAGPIAFAVLGAGGAAAAAGLTPYRPFILAGSLTLLAVGFWMIYRRPPACADGACPPRVGRPVKIILWFSLALWLIAAATFTAAQLPKYFEPAGRASEHLSVGANGEALRAAFNADAGKVRVLMLVEPT